MKVAIVGTAAGWSHTPFDDPEWEKWGLNTLYKRLSPAQLRSFTRWFELHGDTPLTRSRRPADHWRSLDALGVPVYTFYELPDIRRSLKFPLEQIAGFRQYFACTMTYQIALALSEGATHIGLFGMEMTGTREALIERPCLEWWIGYAEGRGAEVTVVHEGTYGLMRQPHRYALDDGAERRFAFAYAYAQHAIATSWLVAETTRLNLSLSDIPYASDKDLDERLTDLLDA